jgi:hypothetical protein
MIPGKNNLNNPKYINQPTSISVPSDSDNFINNSSRFQSSNHTSNHKDFSFRDKRKVSGLNDIVTFADFNSKANTIETMKSNSHKGDILNFKTREGTKKNNVITRSEQINCIKNENEKKIHNTIEISNKIGKLKEMQVSSETKNRIKQNSGVAKKSHFGKPTKLKGINKFENEDTIVEVVRPVKKTLYRNKRKNVKHLIQNIKNIDLERPVHIDSKRRIKEVQFPKAANQKKSSYKKINEKIKDSVSPPSKSRKSRSLYTKNLRILNPNKNKNIKKRICENKKKKIYEDKSKNMILKFKRELLKEQPKPTKSSSKIKSSKLRKKEN